MKSIIDFWVVWQYYEYLTTFSYSFEGLKNYLPHRTIVKKESSIYINARFLTQAITGVQRYALEMCRNLEHRTQYRFVLIAPAGTLLPKELGHLDFVTIGKTKGYSWEQIELPAYLKKRGSPMLINFCNTGPLLYRNQIVTIHDLAFLHHPQWFSKSFATVYKFLIPRIAKRAQRVITVSQTIKAQLISELGLAEKNICVFGNGLQYDVLQSHVGSHKEKIIFTVSSINPRKNLLTLIQAFEQAKLPGYKLIICGTANAVFGKQHLPASNPDVIFAGYMDNEQMIVYYNKAEVFASLSLDEGFGIPVLEAVYFNCKLLLSDIPVYKELYTDAAVFVSPQDVRAAAAALTQLVQSQNKNVQARTHLATVHSYQKSAAALITLTDSFF